MKQLVLVVAFWVFLGMHALFFKTTENTWLEALRSMPCLYLAYWILSVLIYKRLMTRRQS